MDNELELVKEFVNSQWDDAEDTAYELVLQDYKGYRVYGEIDDNTEKQMTGYPIYILVDEVGTCAFADIDEVIEIMSQVYKDEDN